MNNFNPFSLQRKTILITGASSGIGSQCAIDCSRMGAKVILLARNEQRLFETLNHCESPELHFTASVDLRNTQEIKGTIDSIIKTTGPLDGFIHCAGVEKTAPLKYVKSSDFEDIYRVNVLSAIEIIKSLSHKSCYNVGCKIVLISSIASIKARQGTAAYAASKGALLSLGRELASELCSKNINVNCILPGTILTPMMQNYLETLDDESREKRISGFPLGLGNPSDISSACIYLLSDAARLITGQNLVIDGGYTAM